MAIRLFLHAFQTIFGNFRQAITVSALPFGLILVLGLIAPTPNLDDPFAFGGPAILSGLIGIVALMVGGAYIAASWHRYVLLEETPQLFGGPALERTLPYLGHSILLGLWLMLFYIPVILVFSVVLGPILMSGLDPDTEMQLVGPGYFFTELIAGTILGSLVLLYSLILPAKALGQSMRFGDSRRYVMPLGTTLIGVSFLIALFNVVVSFAVYQITAFGGGVFGSLLNTASQWITMMVGVSILTTLYGHLVEGRELPT